MEIKQKKRKGIDEGQFNHHIDVSLPVSKKSVPELRPHGINTTWPFLHDEATQRFLQESTCFYDLMQPIPWSHIPKITSADLEAYQLISLDHFVHVGAHQVTSEVLVKATKQRIWITTMWLDAVRASDNLFGLSVMGKITAARRLSQCGFHPRIHQIGTLTEGDLKGFLSSSKDGMGSNAKSWKFVTNAFTKKMIGLDINATSRPGGQCFTSSRFSDILQFTREQSRNVVLLFSDAPCNFPVVPMSLLRLKDRGTGWLDKTEFATWLEPVRDIFCKAIDTGKRGYILHDGIASSQCFVSTEDVRTRWCAKYKVLKSSFLSKPNIVALLDCSLFTESWNYVDPTLEDLDRNRGSEADMRDWDRTFLPRPALESREDEKTPEKQFEHGLPLVKNREGHVLLLGILTRLEVERKSVGTLEQEELQHLRIPHKSLSAWEKSSQDVLNSFERLFFGAVASEDGKEGKGDMWLPRTNRDALSRYEMYMGKVTPMGDHIEEGLSKLHFHGGWRIRPEVPPTVRTWKPITTLFTSFDRIDHKKEPKEKKKKTKQETWHHAVWYETKNYITDPYVRRQISDTLFSLFVEYNLSVLARKKRHLDFPETFREGDELRSVLDSSRLLDHMECVWFPVTEEGKGTKGPRKIDVYMKTHIRLPPPELKSGLFFDGTYLPNNIPIETGFALIHTYDPLVHAQHMELGHALQFLIHEEGRYALESVGRVVNTLRTRIASALQELAFLCVQLDMNEWIEQGELPFDSPGIPLGLILVPKLSNKKQIWVRVHGRTGTVKTEDIVFRDLNFVWMDYAERNLPNKDGNFLNDFIFTMVADAVFSLYFLISPVLSLTTSIHGEPLLVNYLQCVSDSRFRLDVEHRRLTSLTSLVHDDSLETALMGHGTYGAVFYAKDGSQVIKVPIQPPDSLDESYALYHETKVTFLAGLLEIGPKFRNLIPVTWDQKDIPESPMFRHWQSHRVTLALCMEKLDKMKSLADPEEPTNFITGKYVSTILPDLHKQFMKCAYYNIERNDPNVANYLYSESEGVKLIDFGPLEAFGLPWSPSISSQAGGMLSRIVNDLHLRGGVHTFDNLMYGFHKSIQLPKLTFVPVLRDLHSILVKGLRRFTVVRTPTQLYLLAGEYHTADISKDPTYMSISSYFHVLARAFPSVQMDLMVERNPLENRKMHSGKDKKDNVYYGGSQNFDEFMVRFQRYNLYQTPQQVPLLQKMYDKLDPVSIRVSLVDSRVNKASFRWLEFFERNRKYFDMMKEYPHHWSDGQIVDFCAFAQELMDLVIPRLSEEAIHKEFGYTKNKEPLLDLDIQINSLHPNFEGRIKEYLQKKKQQLEKDMADVLVALKKMAIDVTAFEKRMTEEKRTDGPFVYRVSSTVIDSVLWKLLADAMDVYVYTRFFHLFEKSQPTYAKNILYLAGQTHTDNAIAMLVKEMKGTILYDAVDTHHDVRCMPSMDLLEKHWIR